MKEEYIDVNRLKENLITEIYSYSKGDIRKRLFARGLSLAYDIVNRQPTVEPKHGHWIDRSVAFYRKCSECGCCMEWNKEPFLHGDGEYNYCPNCGAKMDAIGENDV